MTRRSFLKLPALLPLTSVKSPLGREEHFFQYEGVIGTSLDLQWSGEGREELGAEAEVAATATVPAPLAPEDRTAAAAKDR